MDHLDLDAIRHWLGDAEIAKGRPYARDALTHLRRQGTRLGGDCFGSRPTPYRVRVDLDDGGVRSARCSCPVGGGGRCKHVAALLLAWTERPAAFRDALPVDAALADMDRDELIALVGRLLDHNPELEPLVEAAALETRDSAPSPETLQPLVRTLLGAYDPWGEGMDDPYGSHHSVASDAELDAIVASLERRLASGDVDGAAAGFDTIAGEILEVYSQIYDEEGTLAGLARRCTEGLVSCLRATDPSRDTALRRTILASLFELFCQDLGVGGFGVGDPLPAAVTRHATTSERRELATWIDAVLPDGEERRRSYEREALGRLLLTVQADVLDDDAALAILRRSGDDQALFERLLQLGRVDEAADATRAVPANRFTAAADLFEDHGHADLARQLVEERRERDGDAPPLLAWLRDHAEAHGRIDEALRLDQDLFWRHPTLQDYVRLERLARRAERWDALRTEVLARLERGGRHALLIHVHLHEGDTGAALARLEGLRSGEAFTTWHYGASLAEQVAEAAERSHPDAAARLYERQAETLIEARGRPNYQRAAELLARVRDLRLEQGEEERWLEYIESLRSENRRLRAFKEELIEAGL